MKRFLIKHQSIFMLLISGIIMGITVVCPKLGFLQWFAMIPAAISLIRTTWDPDIKLRKIYGRAILYFWMFYGIVFHWFIYMYPLEFVGLSKASAAVVVVLACVGLSFLQSLFSALSFIIIAVICRKPAAEKYKFAFPFVAAAAISIAEWFQTLGWWGVPWGRIPLGQIESALFVRSSSLFGSYFVTFIIVAVNFLLAQMLISENRKKVFLSVAISIFAFNLMLGTLVTVFYREEGRSARIAVVQGNIPTGEIWNSSSHDKTVREYDRLTVSAASNGADLILWPETVFPYDLTGDYELEFYIKNLARDNNTTVIGSAYTRKQGSRQCYNSLIEARPDGSFGEVIYHKQHLVPFGEYLPMRDIITFLIPPLSQLNVLAEDLLPGEESLVMDTSIGKVGFAVCFDSIFEHVVRDSCLNGAKLIAVSTNDSWFSGSAALEMHNSQSRLRAIESGKYIIRAANTGISSVIDPLGNVVDRIEEDRSDYIVSDVYLRESNTLYTYIGNTFVYLCIAFLVACLVAKVIAWKKQKAVRD